LLAENIASASQYIGKWLRNGIQHKSYTHRYCYSTCDRSRASYTELGNGTFIFRSKRHYPGPFNCMGRCLDARKVCPAIPKLTPRNLHP
jgi:hypothetical protein